MAYQPIEFSKVSAVGTNSYTLLAPSGALWIGNNFRGAGEENNFAYVGVNLQTDEAGTLTFEFSQDGTNWSKYPVTNFTITAGINEVHTAWKGGRYIRPVYSGSNGAKTYFRLETYYSNHPLPLSAPLNQSINGDQDATVVRSVTEGLNANSTYTQKPISSVVDALSWVSGSDAPFSASQIWTSDWADLQAYGGLSVLADGFNSSSIACPGTMSLQFSHNSTDVHRNIVITTDDIASTQPRTLGTVARYFRVKYENGSVGHQWTDIQTMFHEQQVQLVGRLDQAIAANSDVQLVRSVVAGKNLGGTFNNVQLDSENNLETTIKDPLTAFGDLRITELTPVIQTALPYNVNPQLVSTGSNGTATVATSQSLFRIETGATAGSSASMESIKRLKYRPGLGGLVRFTTLYQTGSTAGSTAYAGIGDDTDGYFVAMSGSHFGVERHRDGVITFTSQSQFSIDKLDGTGPSGMTIKPEQGNVFQIQYQWLGFGAIRYSVEEPTTGKYVPYHVDQYANANQLPTVTNPTLPIRYKADNGANAENVYVRGASFAGFTEGKERVVGPTYNVSSGSSAVSGDVHVFTIRNKETVNSITNRNEILLTLASVSADGNNPVRWRFIQNGTVTGTSFNDIDTQGSIVEQSNAGTYTDGSGKTIFEINLQKTDSEFQNLKELEFRLAPLDTLTCILTAGGANANCRAAISWAEDV